MKTLTVTSPTIQGKDVLAAQRALSRNDYGQFYRGDLDGEFGPITGAASKDAKFWLGYAAKNVTVGYGDGLHNLLTGTAELAEEMAERRRERKRRPPAELKRRKMLDVATTQLGITESPSGSNSVKFSRWYGITGPWCAMFVTWCGIEADLSAFVRGSYWAYCPFMVSDALNGRNGLRARGQSEPPSPGDIVLFDWGGDRVADHVGIFERGSRSSFTSIEGNTAVGNDSNGGEVMRRSRSSSVVRLFAYAVR